MQPQACHRSGAPHDVVLLWPSLDIQLDVVRDTTRVLSINLILVFMLGRNMIGDLVCKVTGTLHAGPVVEVRREMAGGS